MGSIRENAETYESAETKNIVELDKVNTEIEVYEKTFKEGTDDEFTVNLIKVDDEEYRVPDSVLKSLKEILATKKDVTEFKVTKTGTGKQTTYTVIPLN